MMKDSNADGKDRLRNWLPRLAHMQTQLVNSPEASDDQADRIADSESGRLDESAPIMVSTSLSVSGNWVIAFDDSDSTQQSHESADPISPQKETAPTLQVPTTDVVVRELVATTPETALAEKPPIQKRVLHLPVDGILSKILKTKPFLLGLGSVGQRDPSLMAEIALEIATRCAAKADRKPLIVRITGPKTGGAVESSRLPGYQPHIPTYMWHDFGESKMEKLRWNTQLSELIRLRREFDLILFDLGDVGAAAMIRLGRLCDGIVVQQMEALAPRAMKNVISELKQEQLKLLGLMSLQFVGDESVP